ncbi:MAG TPA: hypothetical protein VFS52_21480 [Steroidobacteraceae bacterium]|jgi:hypothetical protein|nr:hypothetical protein [Steroidobacteraceae bacterium]
MRIQYDGGPPWSSSSVSQVQFMILGMTIPFFTLLHVIISLIGIVAGAVVMRGLWSATRPDGSAVFFLTTTAATSVTGFLFHSASFGAAHFVGLISLAVLAVTILALYIYRLAGLWRGIYVAGAVLALYLNVFVGMVQAFQKLPFLHPFAPTGSEPPFVVTQLLVLGMFIALGIVATKRFHPVPVARMPAYG